MFQIFLIVLTLVLSLIVILLLLKNNNNLKKELVKKEILSKIKIALGNKIKINNIEDLLNKLLKDDITITIIKELLKDNIGEEKINNNWEKKKLLIILIFHLIKTLKKKVKIDYYGEITEYDTKNNEYKIGPTDFTFDKSRIYSINYYNEIILFKKTNEGKFIEMNKKNILFY